MIDKLAIINVFYGFEQQYFVRKFYNNEIHISVNNCNIFCKILHDLFSTLKMKYQEQFL